MEQVSQWRALLEDLSREAFYEMEREDREFLDPLQHWVNRLVQRTLPIDWRAQLHAYLAPWEAKGFRLLPASVERLEAWILAWARFRGLLPRATDSFVAVASAAPPRAPAARPFVMEHRYLHGSAIDRVLAQEDYVGNVRRMLADNLGTVRDALDSSGELVEHYEYDAFAQVAGDTSLTRYLYTAREFDATTLLQYNRTTWYDASTGRWLGEDPIGFEAGGANLYRYVLNSPTNFVDPEGLDETYVANYSQGAAQAIFVTTIGTPNHKDGKWSEPWWHGDGTILKYANGVRVNQRITSYGALVEQGGVCNTVWGGQSSGAGDTFVYIKTKCPGVFRVGVYVQASIGTYDTRTQGMVFTKGGIRVSTYSLMGYEAESTTSTISVLNELLVMSPGGDAKTLVMKYLPTMAHPWKFQGTTSASADVRVMYIMPF